MHLRKGPFPRLQDRQALASSITWPQLYAKAASQFRASNKLILRPSRNSTPRSSSILAIVFAGVEWACRSACSAHSSGVLHIVIKWYRWKSINILYRGSLIAQLKLKIDSLILEKAFILKYKIEYWFLKYQLLLSVSSYVLRLGRLV
jgi:hypothetical protein